MVTRRLARRPRTFNLCQQQLSPLRLAAAAVAVLLLCQAPSFIPRVGAQPPLSPNSAPRGNRFLPPTPGAPLPPDRQTARPAAVRISQPAARPVAPPAAARVPAQRPNGSAAAASARLPDSPAEHFASLVDNDPLITDSPRERLANWQTDTNEGSVLNDLKKRLENVEAAQRADAEQAKKKNRRFDHEIFGRMQVDAISASQDPTNKAQLGDIPNGTDFRRLRMGIQGAGYDVMSYRLEVDFVQPDPVTKKRPRVTDAYIEVHDLPWIGTYRVGQFREPYSVERVTSNNDVTFMERGLPQAFHSNRNLGIIAYDHSRNEKWYWWNGIFDEQATGFGEFYSNAPRVTTTNRLVHIPWYDAPTGGRYLAALGAAYNFRNLAGRTISYSTTPEVQLQYNGVSVIPSFISTGTMTVNTINTVQTEAFAVLGPLSFQAEYYGVWVNQVDNPTVFLHGMYVYASYFLTGENRIYDRNQGIFTATKPFREFFRVRTDRGIFTGPGAWEVAARFSSMNLSNQNIQGGRLNDITLGVNWYLNSQCRIMYNYVHAFLNLHNTASNADFFQTRAQLVW